MNHKRMLLMVALLNTAGCSNLDSLGVSENDNAFLCIDASYSGTFTSSNGRYRRLEVPQGVELNADQMIALLQQGCP